MAREGSGRFGSHPRLPTIRSESKHDLPSNATTDPDDSRGTQSEAEGSGFASAVGSGLRGSPSVAPRPLSVTVDVIRETEVYHGATNSPSTSNFSPAARHEFVDDLPVEEVPG